MWVNKARFVRLFSLSNFREFNSPSYGNCFTFNSAFNDDDPSGGFRASSLTGPDYGLAITFKSEQGTYMYQGFTKQARLRQKTIATIWQILRHLTS